MEKLNEEKLPVSSKEVKEDAGADVPADEIEDGGDVETDSDTSSDSSSDSDSESEYECEVCKKSFSGYLPFKQHQKGKKHAKALLKKKKEKKLMKMDETAESDEENLVQEPYADCKTCNKEFYGPEAYAQHLKSKKHKQKALEASILEQVQEDGKINTDKLREICKSKRVSDNALDEVKERMTALTLDDDDEKNQEEFECNECEKLFSGLIPYTQHLMSKTHAKKIEKKNLLHKVVPGTSKEVKIPVKSKHHDVNTLCIEDDILVCKSCSTSFSGPESAQAHMKSKKHAKNLEKYLRKLERKKKKAESKDDDLSSGKESKDQTELDDHDETTKEKLDSTTGDSGTSETVADSSKNISEKSSTSSIQVNEGMIAYEKYKEYKKVMNSLKEGEC